MRFVLAAAVALIVSLLAVPASASADPIGANGLRSYVNAKGDTCFPPKASQAGSICLRLVGHRPQAAGQQFNGASAPADLPAAPVQCAFQPGNYLANPDRFTSCSDTIWELYTYTTSSTGIVTITGSMDVEDQQWTSYTVNSFTWVHGLTLSVGYGTTGTLLNGTTATASSSCHVSPTCEVSTTIGTPDNQPVSLTPGAVFANAWTELDTGPASSSSDQESFQDQLGVTFAGPGGTGIPPWTFQDNYLEGRCDSIVGNADGCVNQEFTPTLTLPLANFGASAAMIQWAQQNLSAKWGVEGQGQPLHRLADPAEQKKNRTLVCGDGSFTPDPNITAALAPYADRDSCDEFPFAASYESAALDGHTTSGAQCAQVTAKQISQPTGNNEAADWPTVAPLSTPVGDEPCVRGHIPFILNRNVGVAYSNVVQSDRLVDEDPFWVRVTP